MFHLVSRCPTQPKATSMPHVPVQVKSRKTSMFTSLLGMQAPIGDDGANEFPAIFTFFGVKNLQPFGGPRKKTPGRKESSRSLPQAYTSKVSIEDSRKINRARRGHLCPSLSQGQAADCVPQEKTTSDRRRNGKLSESEIECSSLCPHSRGLRLSVLAADVASPCAGAGSRQSHQSVSEDGVEHRERPAPELNTFPHADSRRIYLVWNRGRPGSLRRRQVYGL